MNATKSKIAKQSPSALSRRLGTNGQAPKRSRAVQPVKLHLMRDARSHGSKVKPLKGKPLKGKPLKVRPLKGMPTKRATHIAPRGENRWLFLLMPFALLLALGLLLIWERVEVQQTAKELVVLEARKLKLEEENNRLLAQAEQLAGYGRISNIAKERLGLVRLAPRLIVVRD